MAMKSLESYEDKGAREIIENPTHNTKVHLIYANVVSCAFS